jgi:transcriptional regulator with XRE-family HTH domain
VPKTPAKIDPIALRGARKAASLSQRALSQYVGVGLTAVQTWEDGASSPPTPVLPRLAQALNVAVDDLLTRDQHVSPLAVARMRAGLTQTQLGAIVGVSHTFISAVELGRKPLPASWLPALAAGLGITPDDLGI